MKLNLFWVCLTMAMTCSAASMYLVYSPWWESAMLFVYFALLFCFLMITSLYYEIIQLKRKPKKKDDA